MGNEATKNEVVKNEAARYTLLPGENVLLELKVKSFEDDGLSGINVQAIAKNPVSFISKIFAKIRKVLSCFCCCCKKDEPADAVTSGLFVVTSHRCFITKDYIEADEEKKSSFLPLVVIGSILIIVGFIACIKLPTAVLGVFLIIFGIFFIIFAFMTKNKVTAQFRREDHEFISFPRSVLTEFNSFTCNKEMFGGKKTGCFSTAVAVSAYKTVLTVGLNTKGEHCSIAPERNLELVLDPEQVSNHEQALVVVSKLAELAQKAQ